MTSEFLGNAAGVLYAANRMHYGFDVESMVRRVSETFLEALKGHSILHGKCIHLCYLRSVLWHLRHLWLGDEVDLSFNLLACSPLSVPEEA